MAVTRAVDVHEEGGAVRGSLPGATERALIFLHIPKTAGSTLHYLLEREFAPEESFATCSTPRYPHNELSHFEALNERQLARIRLLNGHMGYGLHRYLPRPADYITFLREPVERVLSHYSFERTLPVSPVYEYLQAGMTLKEYVHFYTEVAEMDNLQTRMIAGNWHKRGDGPCTPQMLAQAQENLRERFALVGLAEQFDASYILLTRRFGWRATAFRRRNQTKKRIYRDEVSAEELDTIHQHNEMDIQLYAYVQTLFAQQVRRAGAPFQADLARFRLRRWLYSRYYKARTYSVRTKLRETIAMRMTSPAGGSEHEQG